MPTIGTATISRFTSRSRARMLKKNAAIRDGGAAGSAGIGGLVAEAVDGLDRVDTERAELGADAADVRVDGALGDVVVVAAGAVDELGAGEDAARPLAQRAEHAALGDRAVDPAPVDAHLLPAHVEHEPPACSA